ncbi:MAG: imidazole glycerol phosphate synthase subunit HisH [Hyphomicrobiaceae bacterium]
MTARVALIDYGSGNVHSAQKALERAAREAGASCDIVLTADADVVRRADRIVLPGVGAFADCKRGLAAVPGMIEALSGRVLKDGAPFLGICVGMQLMATRGLEFGVADGLGWIAGDVVRITPQDPTLKIPHMGWNTLSLAERALDHPVFAGIPTGSDGLHAYFVHSYHFEVSDKHHCLATTTYGSDITAVVGRDTMIGTQFHPEKSQQLGLRLLSNFLIWSP